MSSTNRSAARESHISDYYVTPSETILDFCKALETDARDFLPVFNFHNGSLSILDPCSGGDIKHSMAYPSAILGKSGWEVREFHTVDIREDSLAAQKCDYLAESGLGGKFDIIITNPPFNLAIDIIKKSLQDVKEGGLVIMLLRLNFFGSKQRQAFFQENMPLLTYVHTKRPKFLNTGGTDSIEYMHAIWMKGSPRKFTKMRII